jgi:hypothetical protein
MADGISAIQEAHDFYPVLFYFRFPEPHYSASRTTLLTLDAVSLIRAAIPEGENGWIKHSASVRQLWRSSKSLLSTLQETFIPDEPPPQRDAPSPEDSERWARRFSNALATLREAGIDTIADEQEGLRQYTAIRLEWNKDVVRLASYMGWRMNEIDTAMPDVSAKGDGPPKV